MKSFMAVSMHWIVLTIACAFNLVSQSNVPEIKITRTQILVDGKAVASNEAIQTKDFHIPLLTDELTRITPEIAHLEVDPDVPFYLLLRSVASIGRSSCSKIRLYQGNDTFSLMLPEFIAEGQNKPFALKILISGNGVIIADGGKLFDSNQNIDNFKNSDFDTKNLERVLSQARKKMKDNNLWEKHMVVLVAEDEMRFESFVKVLRPIYAIESEGNNSSEEWKKISMGRIVK